MCWKSRFAAKLPGPCEQRGRDWTRLGGSPGGGSPHQSGISDWAAGRDDIVLTAKALEEVLAGKGRADVSTADSIRSIEVENVQDDAGESRDERSEGRMTRGKTCIENP